MPILQPTESQTREGVYLTLDGPVGGTLVTLMGRYNESESPYGGGPLILEIKYGVLVRFSLCHMPGLSYESLDSDEPDVCGLVSGDWPESYYDGPGTQEGGNWGIRTVYTSVGDMLRVTLFTYDPGGRRVDVLSLSSITGRLRKHVIRGTVTHIVTQGGFIAERCPD